MDNFNKLLKIEKEKIDKKLLKSRTQKLYKVGFGPNLSGIISEDSLEKYSNIIGMEEYGERVLYYIEKE